MSKKITDEVWKERFYKTHLDKYDYSKVVSSGNSIPVIITCKIDGHGDFKQRPDNHWRGQGCPKCTKSISEELCRFIFENLLNKKFYSVFIKYKNHNLELDGYNKDLQIAFEYNGVQHYKVTAYIKTKEELDYRIYLDKLKREYCKKNNINLLVIPYFIKHHDMVSYISNWLSANKFYCKKINNINIFLKNFSYTENRRKLIEEIITNKKGILLKYNIDTVIVKCAGGHEWETKYGLIYRGHWCKVCSSKIDFLQFLDSLKKVGINCSSTEGEYYKNKKLKFTCSNNHVFFNYANKILEKINDKNRKPCHKCKKKAVIKAILKLEKAGIFIKRAVKPIHRFCVDGM